MAEKYTVEVGGGMHVIMQGRMQIARVPFHGDPDAAHSLALKMAAAEAMEEALAAAWAQFDTYAVQHQAKADAARREEREVQGADTAAILRAEARERQAKADTNKRFATLCNDALRLARGEGE